MPIALRIPETAWQIMRTMARLNLTNDDDMQAANRSTIETRS